jgi:hypothetical protein
MTHRFLPLTMSATEAGTIASHERYAITVLAV